MPKSEMDTSCEQRSRLEATEHSSDEECDYLKMRQENIQSRLHLLRSIGGIKTLKDNVEAIGEAALGGDIHLQSKIEKKRVRKPATTQREKSKRKRTIIPLPVVENLGVVSRKPTGSLPMLSLKLPKEHANDTSYAATKCAAFASLLKPFLVHQGANIIQPSICTLDMFKEEVSRLILSEDMTVKTNNGRITSLVFHPAQEKVLVASGSTNGDLGLWDVNNPDEETHIELLGPHTKQVNCTSFDHLNPAKILTTSLDGTVQRGDLMKLVFEEIWALEQNGHYVPLTWHDQIDANTLLVGHETGKVVSVDCRKPRQPAQRFECHEHSVQTVHKHPLDDNFFVTASALGEVKIWDRRMVEQIQSIAIWNLWNCKGSTSAFFSCKGNFLLTTSKADHRIRVYHNATSMGTSKPKVKRQIIHKNNTSEWTSDFKAMWHPQREDVFMVGSLDKPRKIQLYGINGQPVYNLSSEFLAAIPAVLAWHPTLPLIVCGNSSARVQMFR